MLLRARVRICRSACVGMRMWDSECVCVCVCVCVYMCVLMHVCVCEQTWSLSTATLAYYSTSQPNLFRAHPSPYAERPLCYTIFEKPFFFYGSTLATDVAR